MYLRLPGGTVLQDGDLLQSEEGDVVVQIVAKAEPVLTVTAQTPIALLRASYHLGNRHVPLAVAPDYLRSQSWQMGNSLMRLLLDVSNLSQTQMTPSLQN